MLASSFVPWATTRRPQAGEGPGSQRYGVFKPPLPSPPPSLHPFTLATSPAPPNLRSSHPIAIHCQAPGDQGRAGREDSEEGFHRFQLRVGLALSLPVC